MRKRIQNIFIVLFACLYSLFKKDNKLGSDIKSFVIIYSTGNIGDMVCVTPVFRAIKKNYPEAKVLVIGSLKNIELLSHIVDVDEYCDISQSIWSLISFLRKKKIDAGISINPNPVDIGILYFGLVRKICSYTFINEYLYKENRAYRIISHFIERVVYTPGQYVPRQHLNLLKPFGIVEENVQKYLKFSHEARIKVDLELSASGIPTTQRIIAFAPGAGSDIKRWPENKFAMAANELYCKFGTPIMIIGGPNDRSSIEKMIANLDNCVHYWNPGPQSMDELKATLSRACLVIGNDSGAIHVGEAVGSATLTIAGSTDDAEHMLSDDRHKVVRALYDRKTLFRSYISDDTQMDLQLAQSQMDAVTVEAVVLVASGLLQRI